MFSQGTDAIRGPVACCKSLTKGLVTEHFGWRDETHKNSVAGQIFGQARANIGTLRENVCHVNQLATQNCSRDKLMT